MSEKFFVPAPIIREIERRANILMIATFINVLKSTNDIEKTVKIMEDTIKRLEKENDKL